MKFNGSRTFQNDVYISIMPLRCILVLCRGKVRELLNTPLNEAPTALFVRLTELPVVSPLHAELVGELVPRYVFDESDEAAAARQQIFMRAPKVRTPVRQD